MKGRVCLVTGGSSGVGKATAMGIARLGATVIILCRSRERGERAVEEIKTSSGNENISLMLADLSAQESIRRFADDFKRSQSSLHVLSNNAGIMLFERQLTPDGIEKVFATDYLSHFLLTNLLLDLLKASAPSRIITVAGNPRHVRRARIDFDDIQLERGFTWVRAAVRAFLARVVFTFELARRITGSGVTANAFDPGLVRTYIHRSLPWYMRIPVSLMQPLLSGRCETSVYLASSPEVETITGKLFVNRRAVDYQPVGYSPGVGRRLWEISEELTGLRRE